MTHLQYRRIRAEFAPVYEALEHWLNTAENWTEVECVYSLMEAWGDHWEAETQKADPSLGGRLVIDGAA